MSMKRKLVWIGITFSVVIALAAGSWIFLRPAPKLLQFGTGTAVANDHPFTYDDYAHVLKTYVNEQGMVNYKEIKTHSERLDVFADALSKLGSKVYDNWSEKEKIAFWINAYNALTLEAIIQNYPIRSSSVLSLAFPKNSIRQIPGVWTKLQFLVMGRAITLNDIEHEILRKKFNEPRVHMALVCASVGCPPLRHEPFTGAKLDAQLEDQTRKFLSNPAKFRIDRPKGRVYLSSIFKWFGEDFLKTYGTDEKFTGHSRAERAVLNFISQHLDANDRDYLTTGKYGLEYLDYDWSLNEQGER